MTLESITDETGRVWYLPRPVIFHDPSRRFAWVGQIDMETGCTRKWLIRWTRKARGA